MELHPGSIAARALALAVLSHPLVVAAQQQPPVFPGEETVVTASRVAQRASEALRNVTVITAQDIARGGQLTLAQVLQEFGGLEITSNGGHGNASAVFMRGANSAHTLVLVDGMRLQSATTGTTAFENIPLAQVERIEIVPGPVSSLYGSDAIGGVIQIFTKGGRSSRTAEASVAVGSRGTGSVSASASGALEATEMALTAGYFRTDNFNVTRPTITFGRFNPDEDDYRNASVSGRITHRFSPGHQLGASVFHSDGDASFDNGPASDHRTRQKLSVASVFTRNRIAANWESLLRVGATRDDNDSVGDAEPALFRTNQRQATWENTFTVGPVRLVAGAEHLEQEVEGTTDYEVRERKVTSLFAGADAELGDHAVQASVRRDDNDQFGEPTTGSVAYGYRLSPAWRLRAAYGTAFHAPSFNDLYFPGFGNPALRPERSRNREAGVDYSAGGHRLRVTYFDNRIQELIAFFFNPATNLFGPDNIARARIRGTEVSYAARFLETDVRAKLTVQDPESLPSGLQLQRRAKRHGSVVLGRTFGAWRVGAEMVASGERFDSANQAPSSRMPGYAIFNLSAGYALSPQWSLDLRWNNVADKDYELVQGFATPGRSVLLTARWTPRS